MKNGVKATSKSNLSNSALLLTAEPDRCFSNGIILSDCSTVSFFLYQVKDEQNKSEWNSCGKQTVFTPLKELPKQHTTAPLSWRIFIICRMARGELSVNMGTCRGTSSIFWKKKHTGRTEYKDDFQTQQG
jgi:hypothetical protein